MQRDPETLNLQQTLGVLRRRAPWILLCVVLAAGAAFAFAKHQPKKYTAAAAVSFNENSLGQQIAGLPGASSSPLTQQANDLELLKLGDMAAKTARLLGHGLTAEGVTSSLSIAAQGESSVVGVSATAGSPVLAANIVNTYVRQFVAEQQRADHRYFLSALAIVKKQLAALTPRQQAGADGLELQNRAQTLSLLAEVDYNNVQVAQEALPSASPTSPKTSKDTLIGAMLGLLLGLGLAFLLEHLDPRIRQPEELVTIYRLPLLGVVPNSSVLARSAQRRRSTQQGGGRDEVLPPAEAEAFSLIRAQLRFFNVDRDLHTIVVASPAPEDGKTTIARHLAAAAARLGSRVLLMEADLRHPTLAERLEIDAGPGLAEVLIGSLSLGEATQSIELGGPAVASGDGKGRTLDVLVAGAIPPPNPAELLESDALDAVLERTRSSYDLVVIDTPPLAVSDALALLAKVDGVIVVGRVGHSRRDAAKRLHEVLAGSGAPALGVVANSSKLSGHGSYISQSRGRNPHAADVGGPSAVLASANGASPSEELVSH